MNTNGTNTRVDPMKAKRTTVYIGTRQSELAMVQAKLVQRLLQEAYPSMKFEIRSMSTKGDRILSVSLNKIGGKSLFTKDLESKMLEGWCDVIVHSLKDVPTKLSSEFTICGIMQREDPRDVVLLSKKHVAAGARTLMDLPAGSIIGTSSVRRVAQIKRLFPTMNIKPCRGNLNTRLQKLDGEYVIRQQEKEQDEHDRKNDIIFSEQKSEEKPQTVEIIPDVQHFDAIVLAFAGVQRLGWQDRISQILTPEEGILYAVGQGCLGLECRANDSFIIDLCKVLVSNESTLRATAERNFMDGMDGSCSTPLAVDTKFEQLPNGKSKLTLIGAIYSEEGETKYSYESTNDSVSSINDAAALGTLVAKETFSQLKKDFPQVQSVEQWINTINGKS